MHNLGGGFLVFDEKEVKKRHKELSDLEGNLRYEEENLRILNRTVKEYDRAVNMGIEFSTDLYEDEIWINTFKRPNKDDHYQYVYPDKEIFDPASYKNAMDAYESLLNRNKEDIRYCFKKKEGKIYDIKIAINNIKSVIKKSDEKVSKYELEKHKESEKTKIEIERVQLEREKLKFEEEKAKMQLERDRMELELLKIEHERQMEQERTEQRKFDYLREKAQIDGIHGGIQDIKNYQKGDSE